MEFSSKYGIGDIVYLKTDMDQEMWLVINVTFAPGGYYYTLSQDNRTYTAYDIEINKERDLTIKFT